MLITQPTLSRRRKELEEELWCFFVSSEPIENDANRRWSVSL
ncbi:MAG: hypothetical protein ACLT8H_07740 [Streptococcus parasanguinis]